MCYCVEYNLQHTSVATMLLYTTASETNDKGTEAKNPSHFIFKRAACCNRHAAGKQPCRELAC